MLMRSLPSHMRQVDIPVEGEFWRISWTLEHIQHAQCDAEATDDVDACLVWDKEKQTWDFSRCKVDINLLDLFQSTIAMADAANI